ncbi:MAG: 2-C-methyl-D-erythritol 2,4-cyclodiphosphate synthase [Bacteroidota bacterium]
MRVGFGYDVHRLEKEIPFRIGGVEIPYEKGALGHSDADVLIHAICDAMLGAAALGDIGTHFPDSDPAYKNIASTLLLRQTAKIVKEHGYSIGNIDSTVCLQEPKIKPYIPDMRKEIARHLGVEESVVSVKATTEEGLGFTGSKEGVSAYAVVLIH